MTKEMNKSELNQKEYMEWLESFTINNPSFMDEDWKDGIQKINPDDKYYAENLKDFYLVIEEYAYAYENQISPFVNRHYCSFFVTYHGILYEIGFFLKNEEHHVSCFCNRKGEYHQETVLECGQEITCIDVEKIINKPQTKKLTIN